MGVNKKINIRTKISPSILSSTPPCPGKILLVFFMLIFLFRKDTKKSPSWQTKEIEMVNTRNFSSKKFNKSVFKKVTWKKFIKNIEKQLKITEPTAPEYVLFGLTLLIFLPLNILPKM